MANKPIQPQDILAAQTPVQAPVAVAPLTIDIVEDDLDNISPEQVRQQKEALELEELKERRAEIKEQRRIAIAARKQNAEQLEHARKQQEATQSLCPHLKPNGQPAIAGQRDHQHHYIFICAYCSKTFNEYTLPPHLRIPSERVGGPNV